MPIRFQAFALGSFLLLVVAFSHLAKIASSHDRQASEVFGSYWASGNAAAHGLNPYSVYAETWRVSRLGPDVFDLNLNPPAMLPYFSLWSRMPLRAGSLLWGGLSLAIVIGVAAIFVWRTPTIQGRQILWLLTSFGTINTIVLGQIYALLLLLSAMVWWLIDSEEDVWAGILLGILVALKPNIGVWPLLLVLSGRYKVLLPSVLTFSGLSLLPVWLYHPLVYQQWFATLQGDQHYRFFTDASLIGYAMRLGHRYAGMILAVVLLLAVAGVVRWARPNAHIVSGIALCAAVLCAPIGWLHYELILAPVLIAKPWDKKQTVGAILLWIHGSFGIKSPRFVPSAESAECVVGFLLLLWSFGEAALSSYRPIPKLDEASV